MNRTSYGELKASYVNVRADEIEHEKIERAVNMAMLAATKKKIPSTMNDMEWTKINARLGYKQIGHAVRHEIYDITPDGKKALVCVRAVEGTRYGQKTLSHNYYIVRQHGKGLRVTPAPKAIAAKAAKAAGANLGLAIAACEAHPVH